MQFSVLVPICAQGDGQIEVQTQGECLCGFGTATPIVTCFTGFAPTWMLAAGCHLRKVSLQRRLQDLDRVLHARGRKGETGLVTHGKLRPATRLDAIVNQYPAQRFMWFFSGKRSKFHRAIRQRNIPRVTAAQAALLSDSALGSQTRPTPHVPPHSPPPESCQ